MLINRDLLSCLYTSIFNYFKNIYKSISEIAVQKFWASLTSAVVPIICSKIKQKTNTKQKQKPHLILSIWGSGREVQTVGAWSVRL